MLMSMSFCLSTALGMDGLATLQKNQTNYPFSNSFISKCPASPADRHNQKWLISGDSTSLCLAVKDPAPSLSLNSLKNFIHVHKTGALRFWEISVEESSPYNTKLHHFSEEKITSNHEFCEKPPCTTMHSFLHTNFKHPEKRNSKKFQALMVWDASHTSAEDDMVTVADLQDMGLVVPGPHVQSNARLLLTNPFLFGVPLLPSLS